jgi:hypothetical protein
MSEATSVAVEKPMLGEVRSEMQRGRDVHKCQFEHKPKPWGCRQEGLSDEARHQTGENTKTVTTLRYCKCGWAAVGSTSSPPPERLQNDNQRSNNTQRTSA